MSNKTADKIAKLEREIEKLKAAQTPQAPPPVPFVPLSDAEWRDQMHQAAEARANSWRPTGEVLRKMVDACGTNDLRDLVHASHAPRTPTMAGIPSSQTVSGVRASGRGLPQVTPGWQQERRFGDTGQHPVPGVAAADRLMDEQDRRDREELAQKLGALKK
jgi:hypothetical protein